MEAAPLDDVKAVLGNLGSSNEARIALLERRFAVPPSPVGSGEAIPGIDADVINGNSMHSIGSGLRHNGSILQTPQGSQLEPVGNSQDSAQGQTTKKRKVTETSSHRERSMTPSGAQQRPSLSPFLNNAADNKQTTPGSKGKQQNTISRYFAHTTTSAVDQNAPDNVHRTSSASTKQEHDAPPSSNAKKSSRATIVRSLEKEFLSLKEENQQLQFALARSQDANAELQATLQKIEKENTENKHQLTTRDAAVRNVVLRFATATAKHERELSQQRLQQAAPRLGAISIQRKGIDVQEVWDDGYALKDLQRQLSDIATQRESIEAARKACKRRLPLPGQPLPSERNNNDSWEATSTAPMHPDDWVVQEEVFKARLAALKRDEDSVRGDISKLESEKAAHIRELKRIRDEEASRFSDFPILNNRYLLLNLLGRGGFSEVFKAFDLTDYSFVAVKIHQLSSDWSEAKKASYVKHSVREYHIHKQLHHPRIVSLLDIFEIDNNTFATVLELCTGGDLEAYIKDHGTLPERESRAVVAQIFSALTYLNTKPRSIIHYDLKPANILFDGRGECKITDFGLSKIVDDGQTQGMELTSQGAGTYWYLPPECFDVKATPLISNKVDVWSVGVILYQMLFGRRPFGHDQSQEQILRNEVMLNAREVQFPTKPSVSMECKDFLRRCLSYRQDERMDVHAAAVHAFLSIKKEKRGSGVGA